jgi:tetratricopeptide (TPR) repeat protein
MNKVLVAALLLATSAGMAAAQDPGIATLVSTTMSANKKYIPPLCPLKAGSSKVNEGADWLRSAVEASDPGKRANALEEGTTALNRAIKEGQDRNAAVWYYLGRINLMKGDLVGADSSFTKAQALEPKCELDINAYRTRVWQALATNASNLRKEGKDDAAMGYLHAADQIYRGNAYAMISIGEILSAKGDNDSAIVYFKRAMELPAEDSATVELHNLATFDYGVVATSLGKYPEATQALNKYMQAQPKDAQGAKALARAYEGAGQADSAKIWSDKAIALGATAEPGANPADPTALSPLFDKGVAQFNDKNYQAAAETFTSIIERSPYYRDALFNLANCYLGLKDGPNLVKYAQRLVDLEPLNENDYSLLGRGHQLANDQAGAIKAVERREALPVNLTVTSFRIKADGAKFIATVTGREPKDLTGAPLKVPVPTVVLEYVDASGATAASQEVTLPAVAPGASSELTVEGAGKNIVAWRYHTK